MTYEYFRRMLGIVDQHNNSLGTIDSLAHIELGREIDDMIYCAPHHDGNALQMAIEGALAHLNARVVVRERTDFVEIIIWSFERHEMAHLMQPIEAVTPVSTLAGRFLRQFAEDGVGITPAERQAIHATGDVIELMG